jgi:hypothetical protein
VSINDGAEYAKAEWEEFERLLKEVLAEVCTPEVLSRKVTDWIPLK